MRAKNLVIGAMISVIVIIIVIFFLIKVGPNIKTKKEPKLSAVTEENGQSIQQQEKEEEVLIANLKQKENTEEPQQYRDAATITQDLQEMDDNIGSIYIPKTGLIAEVYCKQNANKMEEVPCMLYTNQGPNQPGVTILVGHNRGNGTLFSDNNLLEENDEFYFKDYINNEEKTYKVYSKTVKKNDDVSFYNERSNSPILMMQCCLTPTDSENVLIIMAKSE